MTAPDATQAGVRDPEHLAKELVLLFEGTIVMAVVSGNPQVVQQAKVMARRCVDEHVCEASRQGTG